MAMENAPQNMFTKDDKSVGESENGVSGGFDCNICLERVQDPVVTLCGHLYCWPCIYKWIHHQNTSSESPNKRNIQCPVCKSEVSQNTIVPLYGPGQTTNPDSEERSVDMVIPRRPPTPRYSGLGTGHRGHQQHAPPPLAMPIHDDMTMTSVISPSPTMGMLGEMLSGRILRDLETPLFATPDSYNVAGISTRRARRQATQADRSLSRIYTFLFCCVVLCLVLFT